MSIRVENKTDHPSREVGRLVRWVARELDCNDDNLLVRVRNRRYLQGRYYARARLHSTSVWDFEHHEWRDIEVKVPAGVVHLITCGLPAVFPRALNYYSRREVPPPLTIETWQEALVAVVAHECMHHWQFKNRAKRAAGRRRWQFVESECDFAGYRLVRRFREEGRR